MTDKLREQVSMLADDELTVREAELLLKRMEGDRELRDAWGRYHLVGEAMRGTLPRTYHRDFAASVSTAIERETPPREEDLPALRNLPGFRPVAGFAVAASVAMLAVFTLQMPRDRAPSDVVVPQGGDTPIAIPRVRAAVDFSGVRSKALQNQLRGYLLDHREHSNSPRIRGVMPYVQIAAHDSRPVKVDADESAMPPDWQD